MAGLFSRDEPNKILVKHFKVNRLPLYVVKYSSRQLARLLRLPLKELLEIASVYPREFLRGFFDAEGHVDVAITDRLRLGGGAENCCRFLLLRVKKLLEGLSIASTISLKRKAGSIKVIRNESFIMRRASYSVAITKTADVKKYSDEIGFSIFRKTRKLRDALSMIATYEARRRPSEWKRRYSKIRGEWVRRG